MVRKGAEFKRELLLAQHVLFSETRDQKGSQSKYIGRKGHERDSGNEKPSYSIWLDSSLLKVATRALKLNVQAICQ